MKRKPQEFTFEITSFQMLTPTVFELLFKPIGNGALGEPFAFEAGQFISCIIPGAGPGGRDLRRAYSIASAPHTRPVELCVKLVEGGPGTEYLIKLRPGDKFRGYSPYGEFQYRPKADMGACFISTGTGLAPFRSMVLSEHYTANPPAHAICLFGVREENELLYTDELTAVPGLKFVPAVSRPTPAWKGFKGRVTDYLRSLDQDSPHSFPWKQTEYYLCGGGAMIDEVKEILAGHGVEKTAIHQEVYYKTPKDTAVAPAPATQA